MKDLVRGLVWLVCGSRGGGPSGADDWPQFRGPQGDGRAQATGLPIVWSEDEVAGSALDLRTVTHIYRLGR